MTAARTPRKTITIIFIILLFYELAIGKIFYVDNDGFGDFNSIQAAIDEAAEGDEIVVSPGNYYENITFDGKNIVLRSTEPTNVDIVTKTVINGMLGGSVVTFSGTESHDCVLSGFTITGGKVGSGPDWGNRGGGIYGKGTGATIQYNVIKDNLVYPSWFPSSAYGGGIYDCDGTIQYNIVSGNRAIGHESVAKGGGLYGCDGIIHNNIISGNYSEKGGGLYDCQGTIESNTIVDNLAREGGGLYNCNGSINNCIIRNNGSGEQISHCASEVTYSDIEGGYSGTGNVDHDPCFAEPGYMDDNGTPDRLRDDFWINGDYHLKSQAGRWDPNSQSWVHDDVTSPCIDAGDPMLPIGLEPLPNGNTINMGAYGGTIEGSKSHFLGRFVFSTELVKVVEGQTATFTVALLNEPPEVIYVVIANESGDADITIDSGSLLIFEPSNYSEPQIVTLAAAEDADYIGGKAIISVRAYDCLSNKVTAIEVDNDTPPALFVDADAHGKNDGSSWADAFTDQQEALRTILLVPEIDEIRVAQGIYKPAEPNGDRNATFGLVNGVILKGGYAGFGEPNPNARETEQYKTILSGDLNGDDEPGFASRTDNCFHVVTCSGADCNTIMDGFTVTGGDNA